MKNLLLATCVIFSQAALAEVCIPREFAAEGVSANYEKITAEEGDKLADIQKSYAELMQKVREKKDASNKLELVNAFVDAAGMIFWLHTMMENMRPQALATAIEKAEKAGDSDKVAKLAKQLKKLTERMGRLANESIIISLDDISSSTDLAGQSVMQHVRAFFEYRIKVFKAWVTDLKGITSWAGKAKEMFFFSMKKIGFVSIIMMVPMGAYIWMSRIKEEQRLTALTSEQDKVMKQAMLFELFVSQKSFAELAATRAQLQPDRVCPPTT